MKRDRRVQEEEQVRNGCPLLLYNCHLFLQVKILTVMGILVS